MCCGLGMVCSSLVSSTLGMGWQGKGGDLTDGDFPECVGNSLEIELRPVSNCAEVCVVASEELDAHIISVRG